MLQPAWTALLCLLPTAGGPGFVQGRSGPAAKIVSPAKPANPDPKAPRPGAAPNRSITAFRLYEKQTSRELFAACDLNRDDRLSWFEARKTLAHDLDRKSFHELLDRNRDGVVTFDEFDAYFRSTTELGGELRILPAALERRTPGLSRLLSVPKELQRFFALLDRDHDERITPEEWKAVAALADPKGEVGFEGLDRDLSGALEIEELRPLLPMLTLLDKTLRAPASPRLRPLPSDLAPADLNGDSLLDEKELRRALMRIHPSLGRHATTVLVQADRNGDRKISATEIPRTPR